MWLWHPHSTYRVEVLHIQVVSICLDMLGFLLIIHPNKDPPKDDGIAKLQRIQLIFLVWGHDIPDLDQEYDAVDKVTHDWTNV